MVMINHGIITGALFILLGYIYKRRHTYEISELKGLQKVAPMFAGVFMVMMLSSIGLPGLNGFVGEFLVLIGTFLAHRWWAVVAADRRDHRGGLHAVGLPAGVPRRARRSEPDASRISS